METRAEGKRVLNFSLRRKGGEFLQGPKGEENTFRESKSDYPDQGSPMLMPF